MKLNPDFILHDQDGETILVPTGNAAFAGIVRGNKTFGAILELLQQDITEEQIVRSLNERFDAPEGAIQSDVQKALSELRKIGAVLEETSGTAE